MRVLLISNSGRPLLEHCREAIVDFLGDRRRLGFVTAATLGDETLYLGRAREAPAPAALRLVPFNISPHPRQPHPAMAPGSETRDDRIREYHVVNANAVYGIEEGTLVRLENGLATVLGRGRVKVFRRGADAQWYA